MKINLSNTCLVPICTISLFYQISKTNEKQDRSIPDINRTFRQQDCEDAKCRTWLNDWHACVSYYSNGNFNESFMKFKYKIGQEVSYREEAYTIVQLQVSFDRPYYRLSNGWVIHEDYLYA